MRFSPASRASRIFHHPASLPGAPEGHGGFCVSLITNFSSANSGSRGAGAPGGEPNRILPPASLEVTGGFNHDWTRIYHLFFVVSFCSGFLTRQRTQRR